jgi:hypothetical protein
MGEETSLERMVREKEEAREQAQLQVRQADAYFAGAIDNAVPRVAQPFMAGAEKAIGPVSQLERATPNTPRQRGFSFTAYDHRFGAEMEALIGITGIPPIEKNPHEVHYMVKLTARIILGGKQVDVEIVPDQGTKEKRPYASEQQVIGALEIALRRVI